MLKQLQNSEGCNKLLKQIQSQSMVECRFPQSSEITEIIAVYPQVSLVSCEVSSGRVNYAGKLILSIVYCDEEGKLCRMQKGAEFSHFADDDSFAPAQSGVCKLVCDKTTVKREGSSFVIAAIISADIGVYARVDRTYVNGAEGAFVKTESVSFSSAVTFSGESEIEDDFDADSVVDVLIPCAKAVVLSAVCGTGEVQASGEIYLSLFAMRQQTPVCMERIIPFKCTVPCDDATAGRRAAAHAEISDLNVTANVNEDKGRCEINFVCNLNLSGWFADEHTEEVAVDAFSDTNLLELTCAEESLPRCVDVKVYTERVSGLAATKSKLGYDCKFLAAALPHAECAFNEQTGCVEGAVNTVLVYEQNGEIKSTDVNLPFSVALTGAREDGQSVCDDVAVCGVSVRLKAEGEAEAEATLKISATVCEEKQLKYLTKIEEGEAMEVNDCAVSVFLPAEGDGLWDIAKKLNKSPSEVSACNSDLKFPLTGKERIIVYRSKKAL
ncbi:MAG: DUF3794 domain-containing protein [Clostridia bacterium]|nr:DUF3794 domain-containing protein [Clostridia bacterium]